MPFKAPKISTYKLGDKAAPKGALRIGAVRFLPRGVKKSEHKRFFDIWLPLVAPSKKLVSSYTKSGDRAKAWPRFSKAYESEIRKNRGAVVMIAMLAEVARHVPVALGCYCAEEKNCHRSVLRRLVAGALKAGI